MKLLALDTSSLACTVGVRIVDSTGDAGFIEHEEQPRQHTRLLMPMIRTPFSVIISSSTTVPSTLPPDSEAAISTITLPRIMRFTTSAEMSTGALRPNTFAVVMTMSESAQAFACPSTCLAICSGVITLRGMLSKVDGDVRRDLGKSEPWRVGLRVVRRCGLPVFEKACAQTCHNICV